MKNKLTKILSKPKIVIPVVAIIGIFLMIVEYNHIGKAPEVNVALNAPSSFIESKGIIDLSFPKNGRVAEVLATNEQTVHKGDILARLSAPDQEGAASQAKGALDLAEAEFASLNSQYASTKKQQDLIVKNAYQTLLSSGLEGVPSEQDTNVPIISGAYTCGKEGSYLISPYKSADGDTGYSFVYSGLENGVTSVKYDNPVLLGNCGLQIKFAQTTSFNVSTKWTINIPNTKSPTYLANKNAYELAKQNEEKALSDLATTIGNSDNNSIEKAKVAAARGAYEAALGAYQNNLIVAPENGTISFIDKDLLVGQSVISNKIVISITAK